MIAHADMMTEAELALATTASIAAPSLDWHACGRTLFAVHGSASASVGVCCRATDEEVAAEALKLAEILR